MKKFIAVFTVLFAVVSLYGAVGWCGMIWPNSGTEHSTGEAISVYFQIWKDGVTDGIGRGDSIAATLYWRESGTISWDIIEMTFTGDVGNNDEYSADIPAPTVIGDIDYYCEALDSIDMITTTGTDQNDVALNTTTPGVLHIVDVTAIDVTVTFQVDMALEDSFDIVTVAGTFNDWSTTADTMTDPDMDGVYSIDILFPAGSNPSHDYKFIKDGVYEWIPNRSLAINDSFPTQIIPVVNFNNLDPDDYTALDIAVHFSVDMSAEVVTNPYIAGNVYPLVWGWSAGWSDSLILYDDGAHGDGAVGDGVYGAIINFPSGSYRDVEYKYTTDSTDNEPLPPFTNHTFTLGDSAIQVLPMDVFGVLDNIEETVRPGYFDISISPNPFNSAVGIEVRLDAATQLDLRIFDIRGRQATALHDGPAECGTSSFIWHAEGAPSGIYLLRAVAGGRTRTERLLLVK